MAHIKVPHLYHHRNRHINHYTHADSYHYVINASETKYAIMSMGVPADASLGDYYHKINATVYASGYEYLGSTSETAYTGVKTSAIPEFPMMAIPLTIVLAVAFLIFRRRG